MFLVLACTAGVALAQPEEPGPTTEINAVVMYAVDDDTHELVRYSFGLNTALVIDQLRYADGTMAYDLECLGYIPSGPHKGLYGAHNYDGNERSRLVRINVFDATVVPVAGDIGFGNVEGMIAAWDPDSEQWYLYGTQTGDNDVGASEGDLHIDVLVNGATEASLDPAGAYVASNDTWFFSGSFATGSGVELQYNVSLRPDGMLGGGIVVENTSAAPVDIVVEMTAPTTASRSGGTELVGSDTMTFTTDGGGGAITVPAGGHAWQMLLDATPVAAASLFADPFMLQHPALGSSVESESFGVPTMVAGPPCSQSMGLRMAFSLTSLDQVSMTGGFSVTGDADVIETQNLIRIDPSDGQGTFVMALGERFEGLARGADGMLYGARDDELWQIDVGSQSAAPIGGHGFAGVQALEYAFGDYEPEIDVPEVPDDWTDNGILFGFSDAADAVLIINPATGEAGTYECAVSPRDIEGMVFLTEWSDPFNPVIAGVGD